MARPSHPLDEPGDAAAGEGHEQAHEDLRLERADQGRDAARARSTGNCSGFRRARRRRPGRSWRSSRSCCWASHCVLFVRQARRRRQPLRRRQAGGEAGRCRTAAARPGEEAGAWSSDRPALARCSSWRACLAALGAPPGVRPRPAARHLAAVRLDGRARSRPEVIFKFNQAVGGTLGAVRVYDAQGNEVDNLDVAHPDGHEHWMGVGLKPHLPDGTYTATYRVISADTHIVYGGLVFNIGHAGAAPTFTVAGLIGRNETGEVTTVAFGVVRFLDYLSIALLLGGLAFSGGRLAARARGGRRRRAALAGARWRSPGAAGSVAVRGGRARRHRERARRPAAGRERRRRVAVGLAERHGPRRHARQSLRSGVGRARDRLAAARRVCCSRRARGTRRGPALRSRRADADGPRAVPPAPRWLLGLLGARRAYLAVTPALAVTRASRARSGRSSRPMSSTCSRRASGSAGSPACCSRCPRRPAGCRRRSAPGCCWRRSSRFSPLALGCGDRDRCDRRRAGLHRRAHARRPAAHDLRPADARQDRAAGSR